jgi:hypothetical protein
MPDVPGHDELEPIQRMPREPVTDKHYAFDVELRIEAFGRPERDKRKIVAEICRVMNDAGIRGHTHLYGRKILFDDEPG